VVCKVSMSCLNLLQITKRNNKGTYVMCNGKTEKREIASKFSNPLSQLDQCNVYILSFIGVLAMYAAYILCKVSSKYMLIDKARDVV